MKSLKLKSVRLFELSTVVDSISPKDLNDLKSIRLASNLVKDMQNACKEYSDMMNDINVKQMAILKTYQEKVQAETKEMEEGEKEVFVNKINLEFQKEVNEKFGDELKATQEKGEEEVECELSDEKHVKLLELFEKFATKFYTRKDALLEVAEALGMEEV